MYGVLQAKREIILSIAKNNGVQNIRIFGSVARQENVPASKLDLLVNFKEEKSLFDLIRFKQEIENSLNIRVNVVTEDSIHWSIKQDVLNEAIQL